MPDKIAGSKGVKFDSDIGRVVFASHQSYGESVWQRSPQLLEESKQSL